MSNRRRQLNWVRRQSVYKGICWQRDKAEARVHYWRVQAEQKDRTILELHQQLTAAKVELALIQDPKPAPFAVHSIYGPGIPSYPPLTFPDP